MALPNIPTEISSLTSEHHEENAKSIQKLDSLDNIYKTYVSQESNANVTDSSKAQKNKTPIKSVLPKPKLKSTSTLASLPLTPSTPTQLKAKKTLRSFLQCKIKKAHDKLSHVRIPSGEMISNMRYPQCDNCDCATPTNSNVQFNTPELTPCVAYTEEQGTNTTGLYEQPSTDRNIDGQNVDESVTSLCYCRNHNNPVNDDYQQQGYSNYSDENNACENNMQTSVNMSTQSFSQDSCCCHSPENTSQHDYYEYEYTSDDAQQPQTYTQLTQMAQKIAQQIAQQFYQQQLCQQMGQQMGSQIGSQMGQQTNQQMSQQIGQPMTQLMGQSISHPFCPSIPEARANPQLVQQSTACNYGNEQIDQQYCGGMPQVPYYGCNPNCIDVERFVNNYPANNTCSPRIPVDMLGAFNGNSCNDGGAANVCCTNDMLHSQTVYSTDYKALCPQGMQMPPNSDNCGAQQPTFISQYNCDCSLPGGYNMGNDFNYSYSLPTTSCPFPMPMQSTDLSQNTCESLSTSTGSASGYDCSGAEKFWLRPITICIMYEWNGNCCPPCDCQIVNGPYYPSRYQCALDNACMQNMPNRGLSTCEPMQKYVKRNGLSDENLRSNLNGYPNQRRSKSAEPRKCVCFNKNGKEYNEEKFSNMVPPSFLCTNVETEKKQQKNNKKESDSSNESEDSSDLMPINCYISRDGVEKLCNFYKIGSPSCSCDCCCRKEESPRFVVLPMTAPGGNHQNGARMPAQIPNCAAPPRASTKKITSKLTSGTIREVAGQSRVSINRSSSVPPQSDGAKSSRGSGKMSPYDEYKQKTEDCTLNCCGPLKTCACEPTNCIDKVPVQTEVPGGDYDCKEDGQKIVCCLNIPGACYNRNKCCLYPPSCNVTITGAEPIDPPNDSLFDMKKKSKKGKGKDGDPSGGCDCGGNNTDCICTKGGGDDEKGWCCPWYMYGSIPVQPPRGNLYNYFRTTCCSHCWPCSNAAYTSLGQIQQRQEQQRQAFSLCKPPGNAYDQMVQNYQFYSKQQSKSDNKDPSGGERINAGATNNDMHKPASKSFEFPTIYTGNPMGLAHELYAPFMPWQQSCQCPGGGYVMIGNKCNTNPFSN